MFAWRVHPTVQRANCDPLDSPATFRMRRTGRTEVAHSVRPVERTRDAGVISGTPCGQRFDSESKYLVGRPRRLHSGERRECLTDAGAEFIV